MQIFVKALDGRSRMLNVDPSATVSDLKGEIYHNEGIKPDAQRLIYAGKQLLDDKKLIDYNITKECTIHLALRMLGGQAFK